MFRFITAGESHGPSLTGIIKGLPADLAIDIEKINFDMTRRQQGFGCGGSIEDFVMAVDNYRQRVCGY